MSEKERMKYAVHSVDQNHPEYIYYTTKEGNYEELAEKIFQVLEQLSDKFKTYIKNSGTYELYSSELLMLKPISKYLS